MTTLLFLLFLTLLAIAVTGSPDETEGRCPEGPSVSGGLPVIAIARRVRTVTAGFLEGGETPQGFH